MLDNETLRQRFEEARDEAARLSDELKIVAEMVTFYERLLRARGVAIEPLTGAPRVPRPPDSAKPPRVFREPTGIRGAVLSVLRSSPRPIHTAAIVDELRGQGIEPGGKDPRSTVDLALLSLSNRHGIKIEKTAPRTWMLVQDGGESGS